MYINKKILLFTLEYPPQIGGVANYYENLARHWPSFAKVMDGGHAGNIKVLTGKKLLKPHWLCGLWHLWRAVKKLKAQTVLVGHILPLGTVAWLLQKTIRFDYVVFLHGMDLAFALRRKRKRWLARKILQDAKKVICANSFVAEMAKRLVSGNKVAVVNPGVAVYSSQLTAGAKDELRKKYNLQNKKILLQVGRLVKRKGYDKVIEAMQGVLREAPDLVYVIIGNGLELRNLKFEAQSKKLEKNVIFISNASDKERDAWYELCDIFIMPAREIEGDFEGFGIVYLEANLRGKPVIAGDSGGVRDAVKHNVNGLLVNPENANEIAQAIVKLYKDQELCKKLGEQGRQRVLREFSWEKQVDKIAKLLHC